MKKPKDCCYIYYNGFCCRVGCGWGNIGCGCVGCGGVGFGVIRVVVGDVGYGVGNGVGGSWITAIVVLLVERKIY